MSPTVQLVSPIAPPPPAIEDLSRGKTGDAVKRWQRKLVQLGYMTRAEVATGPGIFGPKTEAATKRFQKHYGQAQTGVADKRARASMNRAYAPYDAYFHSTLGKGQDSGAVQVWQRKLAKLGYFTLSQLHRTPGKFDDALEKATRAFQRDFRLNVSGRVGSATRQVMERALDGRAKRRDEGPKPVQPRGVPYINQLTSDGFEDDWNAQSNCGPSTMAMIAKAFGFRTDWRDGALVNWLGGTAGVGAQGVSWPGIMTMANAAGLRSTHRSGSDVEWIRNELKAGRLVAANGDRAVTLQNGGNPARWGNGGGGHWIAVVGIAANGNFLVLDPSTDCRQMPPSELKRYFDTRYGGGEMVSVGR